MRISIRMDNTFGGDLILDEMMIDLFRGDPVDFVMKEIRPYVQMCVTNMHLKNPARDGATDYQGPG